MSLRVAKQITSTGWCRHARQWLRRDWNPEFSDHPPVSTNPQVHSLSPVDLWAHGLRVLLTRRGKHSGRAIFIVV